MAAFVEALHVVGQDIALAHQQRDGRRGGGITQRRPHDGLLRVLTGTYALYGDGSRRDATRDKILIDRDSRCGAVVVGRSQHRVAVTAGEVVHQERVPQLVLTYIMPAHVVIHNGRGGLVTLLALIVLAATRKGEIGHHAVARRFQVDVVFPPLLVVHLEIRSAALRVNHAEIGLHAQRFLVVLEELAEVLHRGTFAQCFKHQHALFVHFLVGHVVVLDVVRRGVHDGKSRLVDAGPHFAGFYGRVDQPDKGEALALVALDAVVEAVRVAVLEHHGTSVRSGFAGHDDRRASQQIRRLQQ